jgi:ABC-type amino acid transport substrate-binding protein
MTKFLLKSLPLWAGLWLLLAGQCQAPLGPPPTPTPAVTPTLRLLPPLQPGDGSDLVDQLLERGLVRVGVRVWPAADFSPPVFRGFSDATSSGVLTGFEVDIARLLAAGLGLDLELVEAYPPVINSGTWSGEWDIALASLVPFDATPGSANSLRFSQPYAYMPMGLVLVEAAAEPESLAGLSGQAIGVLEYSAYEQLLTAVAPPTIQGQPLLPALPPNLNVIPVSNLARAIQHLAGQPAIGPADPPQVQAIFAPAPILQEAVKSGLPLKLAMPGENIGVQPLAVAVAPQDQLQVDRLLAEIDHILTQTRRRGILAEIYLQWYGQDLSHPPPP